MPSRPVMRVALGLYLCLLAAGAAINFWPEPPAQRLVDPADWQGVGEWGVSPTPTSLQLRDSVRSIGPTLRRSWQPDGTYLEGGFVSPAFDAPGYLAIPVHGVVYRDDPTSNIFLGCTDPVGVDPITLLQGKTGIGWSEAVARIPSAWCSGPVQVVAATGKPERVVGVGSPFRISAISFWKQRLPTHVFTHFAVFVWFSAIGLVPALLWRRVRLPGSPLAVAAAGLGLLGHGTFFLMFFLSAAGETVSLAWLVISAVVVGCFRFFDTETWRKTIDDLRFPCFAWFVGSLFFFVLLHAGETSAGLQHPAERFYPANWLGDHIFGLMTSEALVVYPDVSSFRIGDWQISDRPQLYTGLVSSARPFLRLLGVANDGPHLYRFAYEAFGIVANTLWIPALWFLFRGQSVDDRKTALLVATCALTPFALFNSTYTWPKLLSGAFGVFAFALLVGDGGRLDRRPAFRLEILAATVFAVCSFLAHSSSALALLVLGAMVLLRGGLRRPAELAAATGLGGLLVAPWLAWQTLVQPHGNALAKLAFTGRTDFGDRQSGLVAALFDAYSEKGISGWLGDRWRALFNFFGFGDFSDSIVDHLNPASSWIATLRQRDFLFFAPALLPFLILAFWLLVRRRGEHSVAAPARSMLGLALATYGLSLLLIWNNHYVFHLSYPAHLLLLAGVLLALDQTGHRRTLAALSLSVAAYSTIVWIVDPFRHALRVDGVAAFLVLTAPGALALVALRGLTQPDPEASDGRI